MIALTENFSRKVVGRVNLWQEKPQSLELNKITVGHTCEPDHNSFIYGILSSGWQIYIYMVIISGGILISDVRRISNIEGTGNEKIYNIVFVQKTIG